MGVYESQVLEFLQIVKYKKTQISWLAAIQMFNDFTRLMVGLLSEAQQLNGRASEYELYGATWLQVDGTIWNPLAIAFHLLV